MVLYCYLYCNNLTENKAYIIMNNVINEKVITLVILFKKYKAGPNSIKKRTKRSVMLITTNGDTLVKGKWDDYAYREFHEWWKKGEL